MGRIIHGSRLTYDDLPDDALLCFHALIGTIHGAPFQLHIPLGGRHDGALASLTIAPGGPLVIELYNGPDLRLKWETVVAAADKARSSGVLALSDLQSTTSSSSD